MRGSASSLEVSSSAAREELTRAVLLRRGEGLVEVTVQTMAGASFGVTLEERGGSNSSVRALKAEIKVAEGALRHRQELFSFSCWLRGAEEGSEEPLSDDFEIQARWIEPGQVFTMHVDTDTGTL